MAVFYDSSSPSRGDSSMVLQPGALLFGKFRIVRRLGAGNTGTVYECCVESNPGERIAIKLLRNAISKSDRTTARFRNELHASYRVSHSCVVRGKEFFHTDEYLAFTMELIHGRNLSDLLDERSRLTAREVISILSQLCEGLTAIYGSGIVHRDLKPHNILITDSGKVKITDFSAAQFKNPPPGYDPSEIIGTVCYMSPEALEGHGVDGRSDLYSLGVLGYELIAGKTPFDGCEYADEPDFKRHFVPPPPHQVVRDCPKALSKIILKAMAARPEQRFQNAKEMHTAIESLKNPPVFSGVDRDSCEEAAKRFTGSISYRRALFLTLMILCCSIPMLATSSPVFRAPRISAPPRTQPVLTSVDVRLKDKPAAAKKESQPTPKS